MKATSYPCLVGNFNPASEVDRAFLIKGMCVCARSFALSVDGCLGRFTVRVRVRAGRQIAPLASRSIHQALACVRLGSRKPT